VVEVSFTPTLKFQPWINNVDKIIAGGPRGMNVVFDAIDHDLQAVAGVVSQIDAALSGVVVTPAQTRFTPALEFSRSLGFTGWGYDSIGLLHPSPTDTTPVSSVMNLALPDHVRLGSFRAIGRYPGAPMTFGIGLFRVSLFGANQTPEKIAEVTNATAGLTDPFDLTVPAASGLATVDLGRFRYFVQASATQVSDNLATAMTLSTVQLTFAGS
jgi:hypothetical protein